MPRSRKDIRSLLAIFGAVILLATTVITLGTARPTEATWQDTVAGESVFGTHENAGENYARAIATYGTMNRWITGNESRGPILSTATSNSTPPRAETPAEAISSPWWIGVLPVDTTASTCARAKLSEGECAPEPTDPELRAGNFAVAELHGLEVNSLGLGIPLVTYDESAPIRATASCTPGSAGQATVSTGGSIVLGDRTLGNRVSVRVPTTPGVSGPVDRNWGTYDYQATVIHDRVEQMHHAISQVRLVVEATAGSNEGQRWTLNIILARAECGVAMPMPPLPPRPSTAGLTRGAAAPATVQSHDEQAPHNLTAENSTADGAADKEGTTDDEATDSDGAAAAPTTSTPPTTAPTSASPTTSALTPPSSTSRHDESSGSDLRPTTTVTNAPASTETPRPPTSTAPAEPSEVVEGPQKLQDVRVGREFAVVTRDGVELGAARIEDIERLPGCGVEITLEITTSAEDGPDRWASIDHRDFAEVRPGGSTRPAQQAGSECASSAGSGSADLRAGRTSEVVVVIQISTTADRAIFRPAGTAGRRFDLPPLPTTTATSTTASSPTTTTNVPASGVPTP